jgi:hypothetical protein
MDSLSQLDILFLYRHANPAGPILAAAPYLLQDGIAITGQQVQDAEQAAAALRPCDLLMIAPEVFVESLHKYDTPIILTESDDPGYVAGAAPLIHRAAGVIKQHLYTPRSVYQGTRKNYSTWLLAEAGPESLRVPDVCWSQPPQPATTINKLYGFCGFGSWERMRGLVPHTLNFDAPRPIPIHFVGTLNYGDLSVTWHRHKAVEVCTAIGGVGRASDSYRPRDYANEILQAKVVLSPWGWCAVCHRDWEALAAGCVLVKPDSTFLETFPDITSARAPYIPCRRDFADVPAIVEHVVNNWEFYRPLRERGLQLAQLALNDQRNAARLQQIIRTICESIP